MALSLLEATTEEIRKQVVSSFFRTDYVKSEENTWRQYFAYYESELRSLSLGLLTTRKTIPGLAAQSHGDIIYLGSMLWIGKDTTKFEIREKVRPRFPGAEDTSIDRSIDLVVRLCLMLNVRDGETMIRVTPKATMQWDPTRRMEDLIYSHFRPSTVQLNARESRLDPSFTASNMAKLCGLSLKWTDSIKDHLRLDRRSKQLWIFPYKDFLLRHIQANNEETNSVSILPTNLLRETIATLNLLFPHWDPPTQSLLSAHSQTFHTISPFEGPTRLDLREFTYWRDQLFELYEEIYLAPADNWRQLWTDRRNPHQWWTFWVALVVLVLSIISCVASVVQAWASIQALQIQKLSTN